MSSLTWIAQCRHCDGNFGGEYEQGGTYAARCSSKGHHFKGGNYHFISASTLVSAEIIVLRQEPQPPVPLDPPPQRARAS